MKGYQRSKKCLEKQIIFLVERTLFHMITVYFIQIRTDVMKLYLMQLSDTTCVHLPNQIISVCYLDTSIFYLFFFYFLLISCPE